MVGPTESHMSGGLWGLGQNNQQVGTEPKTHDQHTTDIACLRNHLHKQL
jgi:hypothetical protein